MNNFVMELVGMYIVGYSKLFDHTFINMKYDGVKFVYYNIHFNNYKVVTYHLGVLLSQIQILYKLCMYMI